MNLYRLTLPDAFAEFTLGLPMGVNAFRIATGTCTFIVDFNMMASLLGPFD